MFVLLLGLIDQLGKIVHNRFNSNSVLCASSDSTIPQLTTGRLQKAGSLSSKFHFDDFKFILISSCIHCNSCKVITFGKCDHDISWLFLSNILTFRKIETEKKTSFCKWIFELQLLAFCKRSQTCRPNDSL